MTAQPAPTTFSVPQENLGRLEQQLAALNKRAARLHCAPIAYTVTPERTVTVLRHADYGLDPDRRDMEWTDAAIPDRWYVLGERTYYRVAVEGEAPRYAGWTLAAVINVVTTEETGERVPFLRVVPGEAVPGDFWQVDPERCDHCRARRMRNDTFIVRHEDGRLLQVGRQCLADFLGHADPAALARAAELLVEAARLMGDAAEAGDYDASFERWRLSVFLTATALVVRKRGWLSKAKARERWERGETAVPTVNLVKSLLTDAQPGLRRELGQPTEADVADADAAVEWVRDLAEQDDLSDYLRNVVQVGKIGAVDARTAGVAASILAAHRRSQAAAAEAARTRASEWQGAVGEKLDRTVTVRGCWGNQTEWGMSYRTLAADEAGNLYTWYAKTEARAGERLALTGKVKAHEDYRGTRQTVLFYVKARPA